MFIVYIPILNPYVKTGLLAKTVSSRASEGGVNTTAQGAMTCRERSSYTSEHCSPQTVMDRSEWREAICRGRITGSLIL